MCTQDVWGSKPGTYNFDSGFYPFEEAALAAARCLRNMGQLNKTAEVKALYDRVTLIPAFMK